VTRGRVPQRAGSLGLNGGGAAAAVSTSQAETGNSMHRTSNNSSGIYWTWTYVQNQCESYMHWSPTMGQ